MTLKERAMLKVEVGKELIVTIPRALQPSPKSMYGEVVAGASCFDDGLGAPWSGEWSDSFNDSFANKYHE